jgi:phage baseplate assembly protein W
MASPNTSSYSPIGLMLPITIGNNGYFNQTFDTNTQVKQNLINFLNTRKGERRMFPEFGTSLYEVLFEQADNNTNEIIKDIISREISTWIPQISIQSIIINDVKSSSTDNYKKEVRIRFINVNTKQSDAVVFTIENNSI